MPARQDDDLAWRTDRGGESSLTRSVTLAAAVALAVVASLVVFLTADVRLLRLATVVAAWAVVAATVVAVRRRADQQLFAQRELELRRLHDRELDLEAAARRELELELENEARRETEQVRRGELAALRSELAALTGLREELVRTAGAAGDPAELAALREAIRADLRADLGQLPELRADLARLRAELTEQLSSELLVERIIMRTQAFRRPGEERAQSAADLAPPPAWHEQRPPAELTDAWPPLRLDEPLATREYEPVHGHRPSRPATQAAEPQTAEPLVPTPLEWLADRSLLDLGEPTAEQSRPDATRDDGGRHARTADRSLMEPARPVPYRRRHTDDDAGPATDLTAAVTAERPSPPAARLSSPAARPPLPPIRPLGGHEAPLPPTPAGPESPGHARLTEILAERGDAPPSGGRRRRRYRDEDEPDDVLARVLRDDGRSD